MTGTVTNSKYKYVCKKCLDRNLLVECQCGCHGLLFRRDKHGKTRYFIKGHISRVIDRSYMKGENHKKLEKKIKKGIDLSQFNCPRCRDVNWLIECECGCGGVLTRCSNQGKERKFLLNHHMNLEEFKRDQFGENNWNYKGGIYCDDGYWMLTNKWDHPNSQKSDGVIPRHVYNFTVREGQLFCCMLKWGRVHHKIPVKEGGTDDLENLEGIMLTKHISYHKTKDMSDRKCNLCSGKTYTKSNGYEDWRTDINGFLCVNCFLMIDYFRKKFGL